MKRIARLEALEKVAASHRAVAEDPRVKEEEERWQQAWAMLFSTMSKEHIAIVRAAWERHHADDRSFLDNSPAARLLSRCLSAISRSRSKHWPEREIPAEVTLSMPPQVAEVYLQHPGALPLHECEACGYHLPHGYFDACPLCGGRIGWYAYFHRRKAEQAIAQEEATIRQ